MARGGSCWQEEGEEEEAAQGRPRPPRRSSRRGAPRRRWRAALALAAALSARPGALPWLLLRPPWQRPGPREAPAAAPDGPEDWFYLHQSTATFGALSKLSIELTGPPDLARAYLLGEGRGRDSVERLLQAARPLGAEVRREARRGRAGRRVQRYSLALPSLRLLGLGTAQVSMSVWGVVRSAGGPQTGGGPFMEIGSEGGPQVMLQLVGAGQVRLSRLSVDMRGALGVDEREDQPPRIVGWVSLEVQGQVPSVVGVAPPEGVLRPAAREVLRRTLGFATRRLGEDLARDFVQWTRRKS